MVKNSTVQRLMVAVHSEMPLLSLERALELTLQPDRLSRKFWNLNSSVEEKDGAWMTDIIILLSGETNWFFFCQDKHLYFSLMQPLMSFGPKIGSNLSNSCFQLLIFYLIDTA